MVFIPNVQLIFRSQSKSGDYHDDMNRNNINKWLEEMLLPNLPPRSLIVMDYASYHTIGVNKAPTMSCTKDQMQNWIISKGLTYLPTMVIAQLYVMVKEHKEPLKYEADLMLEKHGHKVGGSLLGFICVVCSRVGTASKGAYFSWVSMIAFWFTGILLGFYLFHIVEKFYKIPWLRLEFLFAAVWSLLYLIASILATTVGDNAHYAASFFGFAATLAYMIDAYLKFRLVRAGGLAQGSRVVSKQTTEVITPPGGRY
ncbi:unnamed protein product [Pieris macdunnoughi]|uniref:MARVEL domain-containing protein n=1 Tax=Pieris macdunnoughi TaxID=345717 RepID=A0A821T8C0_9NEOP|nr:unnamed protein product [Pieris macdunnoughi]